MIQKGDGVYFRKGGFTWHGIVIKTNYEYTTVKISEELRGEWLSLSCIDNIHYESVRGAFHKETS